MKKIELTKSEIEFIEKHLKAQLKGLIIDYAPDSEEARILMKLVDEAESLEEELNALDDRLKEPACDLLSWYYKKYREQELRQSTQRQEREEHSEQRTDTPSIERDANGRITSLNEAGADALRAMIMKDLEDFSELRNVQVPLQ